MGGRGLRPGSRRDLRWSPRRNLGRRGHFLVLSGEEPRRLGRCGCRRDEPHRHRRAGPPAAVSWRAAALSPSSGRHDRASRRPTSRGARAQAAAPRRLECRPQADRRFAARGHLRCLGRDAAGVGAGAGRPRLPPVRRHHRPSATRSARTSTITASPPRSTTRCRSTAATRFASSPETDSVTSLPWPPGWPSRSARFRCFRACSTRRSSRSSTRSRRSPPSSGSRSSLGSARAAFPSAARTSSTRALPRRSRSTGAGGPGSGSRRRREPSCSRSRRRRR